jgi:hypothetical protein
MFFPPTLQKVRKRKSHARLISTPNALTGSSSVRQDVRCEASPARNFKLLAEPTTTDTGRIPMDKKYQIFVSSTYVDPIEERQQVMRTILEMGHIPVGMEQFSAADKEQWKIIQRQIDQSDYYVVLIAHRYGSTTPGIQ